MRKTGWINRARVFLLAVAAGGVPLITTVSCDPFSGALDFYRDDDFQDGFFFDDGFYDDCFDCFYEDEIIFLP